MAAIGLALLRLPDDVAIVMPQSYPGTGGGAAPLVPGTEQTWPPSRKASPKANGSVGKDGERVGRYCCSHGQHRRRVYNRICFTEMLDGKMPLKRQQFCNVWLSLVATSRFQCHCIRPRPGAGYHKAIPSCRLGVASGGESLGRVRFEALLKQLHHGLSKRVVAGQVSRRITPVRQDKFEEGARSLRVRQGRPERRNRPAYTARSAG
jgi:hypothetical protein